MYDARDIADYLVRIGHSPDSPAESVHVCPLRLQKLLYYCQGWHLGLFGRPLFRQPIEAWKDGPVVRSVYRLYAGSFMPIIPATLEVVLTLPESIQSLIRMVWGEYSRYTPPELVRRTHEEPAWKQARGGLPDDAYSDVELSLGTMAEYFRGVAREVATVRGYPVPDPVDVWQADEEADWHPERLVPQRDAIALAKASRKPR